MKNKKYKGLFFTIILVFVIASTGCKGGKREYTPEDKETISGSDNTTDQKTDDATKDNSDTEATYDNASPEPNDNSNQVAEQDTEQDESDESPEEKNTQTGEIKKEKQETGNQDNNSNSNNNAPMNQSWTTETFTTTEASSDAYYIDSYAEQVLALGNAEREKAGVSPLTMNYTLAAAARVRAKEISVSFDHTRPDGRSCFTAWDEAGVSYWTCGENIAAGYGSPQAVVTGWVNSPGHYANIINEDFTEMAVSCYYDSASDYGYYWAQCFK